MARLIFGNKIPYDELYNRPISPEHLEEAIDIVEKYPTYDALLQAYEALAGRKSSCLDPGAGSAVHQARVRRLALLGQRALDIRAWSYVKGEKLHVEDDNINDQEANEIANAISESSYFSYFDANINTRLPEYTLAIIPYPLISHVVELRQRLKHGNAGAGVVSLWSPSGYIVTGTDNTKTLHAFSASNPMNHIVTKLDNKTVEFMHGDVRFTCDLGMVLIICDLLIYYTLAPSEHEANQYVFDIPKNMDKYLAGIPGLIEWLTNPSKSSVSADLVLQPYAYAGYFPNVGTQNADGFTWYFAKPGLDNDLQVEAFNSQGVKTNPNAVVLGMNGASVHSKPSGFFKLAAADVPVNRQKLLDADGLLISPYSKKARSLYSKLSNIRVSNTGSGRTDTVQFNYFAKDFGTKALVQSDPSGATRPDDNANSYVNDPIRLAMASDAVGYGTFKFTLEVQ